jgi:hypothetical protein
MGLTFDSPVSATTSAFEKAHRLKSKMSIRTPRARTASVAATSSQSFLDRATQHIRNLFRRSSACVQSTISDPAVTKPSKAVPAADSPFFRLPIELRETIYGLVVGQRNVIHIMMKRRPQRLLYPLVHRRCKTGGTLDDCILIDCKRFPAEGGEGLYFGSFDNIGGLLFSCRDMYGPV